MSTKIYIVTVGENEITVSLNGEAAVTKTVKPTLTALGNTGIRFECDDIDETVDTYRHIFINEVPLKGSFISEEDYLAVALFEAVMNKTFVSSGDSGGLGYSIYSALLSQFEAPPDILPQRNTLSGNPVWTNPSPGIYRATLTGAFTIGKTEVYAANPPGAIASCESNLSANYIEISVRDTGGNLSNDLLNFTAVMIIVNP